MLPKKRLLIYGIIITLAVSGLSLLSSLRQTAEAAPMDNNIIINAINNVLYAISDIDDKIENLEPQSLIINEEYEVPASAYTVVNLLPFEDDQTYSGHLTLVVFGSVYNTVYARAYVATNYTLVIVGDSGSDNYINVDFACQGLDLFIENDDSVTRSSEVYAVVQYTVSTNISTLP